MTPDDPGPDAAALAGQLAAVRVTLADLQAVVAAQRGQLAAQDQRMDDAGLDDLGARFARLAQVVADSLDAAAPKGPPLPRWDLLDAAGREAELGRVRGWVAGILEPLYLAGSGTEPLPACWPHHPAVVMELSWLSILWRYIWDRPRPGPVGQAAEWQDRWLPGVLRRAGDALHGCKYGHNPRPAGPPGVQ